MGEFFSKLLTADFMPHAHCFFYRPEILWLHAVSDLLIVLAYYSIPLALLVFARKRKDLSFRWLFLMFAAFILFCGTTHLIGFITLWVPVYRLDGLVKLGTAMVSVTTAIVLWPMLPKALRIPSPRQLAEANDKLHELNATLEEKVREKTRDTRHLAQIVESSMDAITSADLQGRITSWNASAEQMYGYTKAEMIGERIAKVYEDEGSGEVDSILGRVMEGLSFTLDDAVRKRKDGTLFPVALSFSPIKNEDGKVNGVAVITRDITREKERESRLAEKKAELEQANQRYEHINRELSDFTRIVSHDLKEPCRKFLFFTDMLKREMGESLQDKAKDYVGIIRSSAERMQRMIDDLLQLSRAGNQEMNRSRVNLSQPLGQAMDALSVALMEKGAKVEKGELPTVEGDPTLLGLLFQNLLANAIKFCDKGTPLVEINATSEPDGWVITVADNGIGIDDTQKERIFDPFLRLHSQSAYQGTGIGLSTCRKIVERHGGRIWVENRRGGGSCFRFLLPL